MAYLEDTPRDVGGCAGGDSGFYNEAISAYMTDKTSCCSRPNDTILIRLRVDFGMGLERPGEQLTNQKVQGMFGVSPVWALDGVGGAAGEEAGDVLRAGLNAVDLNRVTA